MAVLPPFGVETGLLPEGEHVAAWDEVVEALGWNLRRRPLLDGLAEAIELLAAGRDPRVATGVLR